MCSHNGMCSHNRMVEAQIVQKTSFSFTPPDRLPSKPEHNPREHCNCVTLKEEVEDFTDPDDILMEKGREIIMAGSKERISLKNAGPGSFSIPYTVEKVGIKGALCDLGASVSIISYSLFHKLHL